MRITSAGLVGIGTSSPVQTVQVESSGSAFVRTKSNFSGTSFTGVDFGQTTEGHAIILNRDAQPMRFFTSDAERARIDASGNLLVGVTDANSPVQAGIKSGTGWTYRTYAFTGGNSRTVTFSAAFNYQVEVTYMATPNTGSIGQSRFIAGRRDFAGANHHHAVADIIGTTADIAVSTSDSGDTRTYTLTLDHATDGANIHHMIEVKTHRISTLSVS
jgi:hypothetical protein